MIVAQIVHSSGWCANRSARTERPKVALLGLSHHEACPAGSHLGSLFVMWGSLGHQANGHQQATNQLDPLLRLAHRTESSLQQQRRKLTTRRPASKYRSWGLLKTTPSNLQIQWGPSPTVAAVLCKRVPCPCDRTKWINTTQN